MNSKTYVKRRKVSVFEAENCREIYGDLNEMFETVRFHADTREKKIAYVRPENPELDRAVTAEILKRGGVALT